MGSKTVPAAGLDPMMTRPLVGLGLAVWVPGIVDLLQCSDDFCCVTHTIGLCWFYNIEPGISHSG